MGIIAQGYNYTRLRPGILSQRSTHRNDSRNVPRGDPSQGIYKHKFSSARIFQISVLWHQLVNGNVYRVRNHYVGITIDILTPGDCTPVWLDAVGTTSWTDSDPKQRSSRSLRCTPILSTTSASTDPKCTHIILIYFNSLNPSQ